MEGLTQEEAGQRMGVSRGTVQRLVTGGRFRVATALSGGKALVIEPSGRQRHPETGIADHRPQFCSHLSDDANFDRILPGGSRVREDFIPDSEF
jgi:transcriptional regulator with XRE-family HTH domain